MRHKQKFAGDGMCSGHGSVASGGIYATNYAVLKFEASFKWHRYEDKIRRNRNDSLIIISVLEATRK